MLDRDRSVDEPERRLRLTCAENLGPRDVEWLWPGRVPVEMITMFAGDPKLGKSYVTLAMAAAVSRGLPLPVGVAPTISSLPIPATPPVGACSCLIMAATSHHRHRP